jgi:transcriptional repressor NrdR
MTRTWRRKKCLKCGFLFTTHEIIDLSHITVAKKDGRKVRFSREKLYSGIYHIVVSGKKMDRGDAGTLADNITQEIEKEIILSKKQKLKTKEIKKIVLSYLKPRHKSHYLRYLAYFGNK